MAQHTSPRGSPACLFPPAPLREILVFSGARKTGAQRRLSIRNPKSQVRNRSYRLRRIIRNPPSPARANAPGAGTEGPTVCVPKFAHSSNPASDAYGFPNEQ